jgi:hypothetical protein
MGKRRWTAGLLGLLLALALAGCGDAATPEAGASVIKIENTAFACERTTGCNTPAALGGRVFAGGEGRTGNPGLLDLQSATTTFRLEEGAVLQLQEVNNAIQRLVLRAGRLFVDHDPSGRDLVTVEAGAIRVDAVDTRFGMRMTGQGAYVAVPQPTGGTGGAPGSVKVSRGGAEVTLRQGEEITVPPTGGMPQKRPIRPSEQALWQNLTAWPP